MARYTRYEVDRLYRGLLDDYPDLWLTQPAWDTQPHARRPPDELPGDVTHYLTCMEALERLTLSQRTIYKVVVLGLIRAWFRGRWMDVRIVPMTYEQAADYLEITPSAVGQSLWRARARLAAMLSDDEEEIA